MAASYHIGLIRHGCSTGPGTGAARVSYRLVEGIEMPYCVQCGSAVEPVDLFCGKCGARQASAAGSPSAGAGVGAQGSSARPAESFLSGINPRTASVLCYIPVLGWVASIVVLASERFRNNRDVRFHAFQGLYLFVVWLFVDWVFAPMMSFTEGTRLVVRLLKVGVFGGWIFMLIKTSQDQLYRLPIIGELAEKSVSEQR